MLCAELPWRPGAQGRSLKLPRVTVCTKHNSSVYSSQHCFFSPPLNSILWIITTSFRISSRERKMWFSSCGDERLTTFCPRCYHVKEAMDFRRFSRRMCEMLRLKMQWRCKTKGPAVACNSFPCILPSGEGGHLAGGECLGIL